MSDIIELNYDFNVNKYVFLYMTRNNYFLCEISTIFIENCLGIWYYVITRRLMPLKVIVDYRGTIYEK